MIQENIIIERAALLQEVHLKNHYLGEAAKRQNLDADIIQSSPDDEELLDSFVRRACNALISSLAMRFSQITFEQNSNYISFVFDNEKSYGSYLIPILKQAITDYLVNEVTLHWLLLRQPAMAETSISLRMSLYHSVQQMFAKIYNSKKIRRRPTDLAGI